MKIGKFTVQKRGDYIYVWRTSEKSKTAKTKLAAHSIKKDKTWGATKYFRYIHKYRKTQKRKPGTWVGRSRKPVRRRDPGMWEYGEDLPIEIKVEYWRRHPHIRPRNWKQQLKKAGITLQGKRRKKLGRKTKRKR